MTRPWTTLHCHATDEGELELRQRGERDFLITVDGRVLMNSTTNRSEVALGQLACQSLARSVRPQVLVGGLGMGYTLRAVLDTLPADGQVLVAELDPLIVQWCRGPLVGLTDRAVEHPRVRVEIADAAAVIRWHARGAPEFDAIVLDLYQGPHSGTHPSNDPLYGSKAIDRARAALKPGGSFAVWGEQHDPGFEQRLCRAGFAVHCERPARGSRRHAVYLGTTRKT